MARLGWNSRTNALVLCPLLTLAVLVGLPATPAHAQAVNDCQPNQYVDRTAPGADRTLLWNFGIENEAEHCMQVRVGQTVKFEGPENVFEDHPLGGSGGDSPNPVSQHQDGSVTFTAVGTFGYVCLAHSSMKGAFKVVAGPPPAVPAQSTLLAVCLAALLLASGAFLLVQRKRRAA